MIEAREAGDSEREPTSMPVDVLRNGLSVARFAGCIRFYDPDT
jgi:hypothetical protein